MIKRHFSLFVVLCLPLIFTQTGFSQWIVKPYSMPRSIVDIEFANADTGYILTSGGNSNATDTVELFKSTDGGASWFSIFKRTDPALLDRASDLFLLGPTIYLLEWNGDIYISSNGGEQWFAKHITLSPAFEIASRISFWNKDFGIIHDEHSLYRTTDGGDTWNKDEQPGGWRDVIVFTDSITGFVAGGYNPEQGSILKTTNRGETWNFDQPFRQIEAMSFPQPALGYAATAYEAMSGPEPGAAILKTTDAGASWKELPALPRKLFIGDMYFVNGSIGYAVGSTLKPSGSLDSAVIATTMDGGEHWSVQVFGEGSFYKLIFASPSSLFTLGRVNDKQVIMALAFSTNTVTYEKVRNKKFTLYPNPASTTVAISVGRGEGPLAIRVFDMLGQERLATVVEDHKDNTSINVSTLAPGLYYMQLDQGNRHQQAKLVIR